jgi:quercetin dioxygenase-like cupin family protein
MSSPKPKTGSEVPVSEAINPLNLISYPEGSIVSQTIVSRETGNVTLFASDETQGLSEHTAPFDALVLVLEGEVEGEVEGAVDSKRLRAKPGDVVLMPASSACPESHHQVQNVTDNDSFMTEEMN